MKPKAHGTSEKPVMKNLKWGADFEVFPCPYSSVVIQSCLCLDLLHVLDSGWFVASLQPESMLSGS
jgi:hypothetical protein